MKAIIIRNDDVGFFTNVELLKKFQDQISFYQFTHSVIPLNTQNGVSFDLCNNDQLCMYLENKRKAIHGAYHHDFSNSFEFLGMKNYDLILPVLTKTRNNTFYKTNIFIPPHNYITSDWYEILTRLGFTIISGTKRRILSHHNRNITFDNEYFVKWGVIREKNYTLIPQSLMIKKERFYNDNNYFINLYNKIINFYNDFELLVITVHWWEFFDKSKLNTKLYSSFVNFLKALYNDGVVDIDFETASRNFGYGLYPYDYFYV